MSDVRHSYVPLGAYEGHKQVVDDVVFRANGFEGPLRSSEAIVIAESVGYVGTDGVVGVSRVGLGNGLFTQFVHAVMVESQG